MGMTVMSWPIHVSSQKNSVRPKTSTEAKKKEAETKKEIQQTEERIRENEALVRRSLAELGKVNLDITTTTQKIQQLNGKINTLNQEISNLESGISKNEKELERLREEYLKAVKKMRVTKKTKSSLAFVFASENMSQAMRRMRYLKEFSRWRTHQTDEINAKTADLKNQRDALAKAKEEQSAALALQKSSQQKLAVQRAQQEFLVEDLKQHGAALQSHLKKKQAEARELGNIVAQLIAEEQRKAAEEEARRRAAEEEARRKAAEEEARLLAQDKQTNDEAPLSKKDKNKKEKNKKEKNPTEYADARKRKPRSEASAKQESTNKADGFEGMRGRLPYPTTGSFNVTSRFGRQHIANLPDVEYENPGIDAESDAGAFARAVYKGKVSGVYLLPGYNTVVIVNHDNYYTVYGNISNPFVKTGDAVAEGSTLGTLVFSEDNPNRSTIHFEVWKNREKLNPMEWLR